MSFEIEDRGNGITWIRIHKQMYQIAKWCNEHNCGKQVNFKQISFKNKEEVTMFLLKWNKQES